MSPRLLVSAGTACLVLAACTEDPPSQSYFPLQEGLSWHYRVDSKTPAGRRISELVITNAGTQQIGDETYHVRKTNTGNLYYLQRREDGIVRLAKRTLVQRAPQFDKSPRFVIKQPHVAGTRWRHEVKPYLLARPQQNDSDEIRRQVAIEMEWEIIATDEAVETAAGRFERCLLVRGSSGVSLRRPLSIAADEVTFTTFEWYAPGVGLVRLEHSEDVDSNQTTGGSIKLELQSFHR